MFQTEFILIELPSLVIAVLVPQLSTREQHNNTFAKNW